MNSAPFLEKTGLQRQILSKMGLPRQKLITVYIPQPRFYSTCVCVRLRGSQKLAKLAGYTVIQSMGSANRGATVFSPLCCSLLMLNILYPVPSEVAGNKQACLVIRFWALEWFGD
jgi:hypothetical protein